MALIEWNDSFSVHVAKSDQQHQKLIGMMNDLHDAMKQGKGKGIQGKIINEMLDYTEIHFRMEEELFEKYGYPTREIHKNEHASFVNKVAELKNDLESGHKLLTLEMMSFLSSWWQNHIKGTDMKYSAFFNEKGVR